MRIQAVVTAMLAAVATPVAAAPQVLGTYPGAFLENLARNAAGELVVTSYFDRTLLIGTPAAGFRSLVTLTVHPVGIAATPEGYVVTAHGAPFTSGPGFTATNRILLLDRRGKVQREIAVPQAKFLNGLVKLGSGWLIADSLAATIWRFDPATGAVAAWLSDPRLAADAARPGVPGANGLKLRGGALYVSNSARGTIDRIDLAAGDRPAGPPQPYLAPGKVDDFAFGDDGTAYVATHADQLLAVRPDGTVATLLADGCESCTAVALDGDGVVVLTTGNRASGGTLPAKILRVAR